MFCQQLFNGIEEKQDGNSTCEVKFSMLEIYNEVARDLLDPNSASKKGGLKIRQHPKKGFYGMKANYKNNPNVCQGKKLPIQSKSKRFFSNFTVYSLIVYALCSYRKEYHRMQ